MNSEHVLRIAGAPGAPTVLMVPPLFDEANRMRRTLVMAMRALGRHGLASLLPDLPGQNDSLLPTGAATLDLWRSALADVATGIAGPLIVASCRGGALIDDAAAGAAGWWRLAPVGGASLVKTMIRTRIAGDREAGRSTDAAALRAAAEQAPVELAGNDIGGAMLAGLEAAVPAAVAPLRTVTPGAGEGRIAGSALWLRAEPGEDATMAAAIADDIRNWAAACVAR